MEQFLSASPEIESESEVAIQENEDFELKCSCSNCLPIKPWWKAKNKKRLHKVENVIDEENDTYLSIYKVKGAKINDEDNYECYFKNDLGSRSNKIKLVIDKKPRDLTITSLIGTGKRIHVGVAFEIKEFKDVTLDCVARNSKASKTTWTKNGKKIHENMKLRFSHKNISEHEGIYKCTIENKIGSVSKEFQVKVKIAPKAFGNSSQTVVVDKAEKISLHCNIDGSPKPEITWNFESQPLIPSTAFKLTNENKNLEFESTADKIGIYSCVGKNQFGQSELHFNVLTKGNLK